MVISSPKQLAALVAGQRSKLGLSQTEVAQRVGLKQKTVSAFENNPNSVMLSTAFLILSALELDIKIKPKESSDGNQWKQEW